MRQMNMKMKEKKEASLKNKIKMRTKKKSAFDFMVCLICKKVVAQLCFLRLV